MWWQSSTIAECVISAQSLITSATGSFLGTALYVSSKTHRKGMREERVRRERGDMKYYVTQY